MIERRYYQATDADAIFRLIDDPAGEVLMGYYANRLSGSWQEGAGLIFAIEFGDSLVAPIERHDALRRLSSWGLEPDRYDA